MIQKISAEDLKKMQDREGLVLQGCGGDLREWEDGIHQMLAEEKILQNGAHFKEIYAFEHDGCTNLLFMMDGIELDTGRLVLWRLRTHAQFGGTWLSDYLPNRLGVEETVWDRRNGFVSVRRRPRPYDNAACAALPHRDGKEQFCPRPAGRRCCPAHACDATGGRADDRGGAARLHPCVSAAPERGGGKTGDAGAVGGSICRGAGCRGMLNGRQALLCVRVCC